MSKPAFLDEHPLFTTCRLARHPHPERGKIVRTEFWQGIDFALLEEGGMVPQWWVREPENPVPLDSVEVGGKVFKGHNNHMPGLSWADTHGNVWVKATTVASVEMEMGKVRGTLYTTVRWTDGTYCECGHNPGSGMFAFSLFGYLLYLAGLKEAADKSDLWFTRHRDYSKTLHILGKCEI